MNREELEALPTTEIERLFDSFVESHPVRVQVFLECAVATGGDLGLFDFSVESMDIAARWLVGRYWSGADQDERIPLPSWVSQRVGDIWWMDIAGKESDSRERALGAILAGSYVADVALANVPGSFFYLSLDPEMAFAFVPLVGGVSIDGRLRSGAALAKAADDRADYGAFYVETLRDSIIQATAHKTQLKLALFGTPELVGQASSVPAAEIEASESPGAETEGPEVGVGGGVVTIVHDLTVEPDRLDRFRTLLYSAFGFVSFEDNQIVEFEIDDAAGAADLVRRLWAQSASPPKDGDNAHG